MAGRRNNFDLVSYWSHILAAATRAVAFLLVCCLIRVTRQLLTAVSLPKKDGCPLWPELDSALYYFYLREENVWGYFFFFRRLWIACLYRLQKTPKTPNGAFSLWRMRHMEKKCKISISQIKLVMESALKTLAPNCNWKCSNERQSKCDVDQCLKYTECANVAVDVLQYSTAVFGRYTTQHCCPLRFHSHVALAFCTMGS